ncbi:2-C-methyl-D-erythritol 4-phosphate cytidylyltransferase [Peptoclostridium litorale DSM 5388]|uniref:2-C-methyl-D-erythritol 4-phosphate cytidylyltransferase n=1 Tax=Peptoclostridium litorale DSM 5388 TaxID=1121324 RepID=A0A069RJ97_PEPLI|nr:2-C-methyl-D-erythritol 4-phosphate cytidylyltransferase [Peptoclostridium litorale]KDR94332.1 2-C-methyl-D-erythritol 4-phosphate cytidylyltransferase IspD [Peptoclostridium litorale DSM 5388]SIO29147.1 2-C-methyl-D-erythritol 4-phosphate cytidylyltransferase [Peptoclostridium litorale DSM 5388]
MNSAIVLCAGRGKRMKSGINKMYMEIWGRPLVLITLESMISVPEIDELVVVISREDEALFNEKVFERLECRKKISIVYGGSERQESVYNGLQKVSDGCEIVIIHDGARPFATRDMIKRTIECASAKGACAAGVPAKDTIKIVDEEGIVIDTPNRKELWCIQTPQTFKLDIIKRAYEKAVSEGYAATDDSMVAEYSGEKVQIVMGDYENIKITTPEDIPFAKAILERRR